MLILQNISYVHLNKDLLFQHISLTVQNNQKIALIGNNGSGKSTLLKIIAGALKPASGTLQCDEKPYYIPQIFGQFNHLTVAEALKVHTKITALNAIINGSINEKDYNDLDDDWTIEERCSSALSYWGLQNILLSQKMENLSGGQKTKVFLAGIQIHQPALILLDEPSNHLDSAARNKLYGFINDTSASFIVVSHDRTLLNAFDTIAELTANGINNYGGNYEFYTAQKAIENNARLQSLEETEKAIRKAREKERDTLERQQRLDNRGKKKAEKAGVAKIMMNTLRNNAEQSTSKLKSVHSEKIGGLNQDLLDKRAALPDIDKMKIGFNHSSLHKGKILFSATGINVEYNGKSVWKKNIDVEINSGERLALKGDNGSGKTTLINIITGKIKPATGKVFNAINKWFYIDQDYSLIENTLSIYEQAQKYNTANLQEHEIKIRLNRFLFDKTTWDKSCQSLSGGERMRLMLCCITLSDVAPDLLIFDEPTNNLDIQNIDILTKAINEYEGSLIVVSHDEYFLDDIRINKDIQL